MTRIEEDKVISIDSRAKNAILPATTICICGHACFFGLITSLQLEFTNIVIIDQYAFSHCYKLHDATFPSCLEEICKGAFMNCIRIECISFPSDSRLLKIGKTAFKSCKELKTFEFPHLLEFIDDFAFEMCDKLKIIDLRNTKVRHIGKDALFCNKSTVYLPSDFETASIITNSYNILCIDSHEVVKKDKCGIYYANNMIFYNENVSIGSRHVLIRRSVEKIFHFTFNGAALESITIPSSVKEIGQCAFSECDSLKRVRFGENSRLEIIKSETFKRCVCLEKIRFPKSLKVIKKAAFDYCKNLNQIIFPLDSQLERIESAFKLTSIKHMYLPPSVREIDNAHDNILVLESVFVSNEYYQSNDERNAIFSRDGNELLCVIKNINQFQIPEGVRVIKKGAFDFQYLSGRLVVPSSVEVIEERAFLNCGKVTIQFQEGSKLKSIEFNSFFGPRDLIINNENFVKMENGVVMSLNPKGIVFVPRTGVEVIYSYAFKRSEIISIKFPNSLKRICTLAFAASKLKHIEFEEGTELDVLDGFAFNPTWIKNFKLPLIKGKFDIYSFPSAVEVIEFPENFSPSIDEEIYICRPIKRIICPLSSINFFSKCIIEEHIPAYLVDDLSFSNSI